MKKVIIYTDGACSGNPGIGGWGAVLMYGEHEKRYQDTRKKPQTIEWSLRQR